MLQGALFLRLSSGGLIAGLCGWWCRLGLGCWLSWSAPYAIICGWLAIHSLTSALLNNKMPLRCWGFGNSPFFHHLRKVWWCMPKRWARGITRIKPSVGKVSNGAGWVFGLSLGVAVFIAVFT